MDNSTKLTLSMTYTYFLTSKLRNTSKGKFNNFEVKCVIMLVDRSRCMNNSGHLYGLNDQIMYIVPLEDPILYSYVRTNRTIDNTHPTKRD